MNTDPDAQPDEDYRAALEFTEPPEAVYDALTTVRGVTGWWTEATGNGGTGGELRFFFGDDVPAIMRVDEARPASLVRWTCLGYAPVPDWAGTTITFELSPRSNGGSELAFRHHGLTPRVECYTMCKQGWDHFLPSLRAYVETGQGNPRHSPADIERREADGRRRSATPQ
ncbi:Uncharacterized conserved protein YndB, AHSA1/START domain [Streptomyces sp. DvalAA-14]|uniref:SRPBCC family protein n=1 Tax=unclassified Streptomyces TaxID=2593676 RepID=UPI00081B498F|nr:MULTISPECIES: SRPBCC domain-containing protein [unclassified Streptomyces]MYS22882.1 SRPBCC domain-containing protein [Streptomyces sp. SID4948]SCE23989.1 Uncharacterized conserved protein YndB, AHSA1/START domain [Streptomyces sp. DvalAA-14]